MGRIRTIKPEFPQSESMGRCSRDSRLLYIMLWTIVDDEGRARAAPRMLASLLYPYDDDAKTHIVQWMFELEREGCIKLYDVDGNAYLQIEKWSEHQKIDRPSKSRLPAPSEGSREHSSKPREPSATDLGPSTMDLGPIKASQAKPPQPKRERKVQTSLPDDCPTEADRNAAAQFWRDRGRGDLCARLGDEVEAFRAHHAAHGSRMADWGAAWRTWYGNAVRFQQKPKQQVAASTVPRPAYIDTHSDGWRERLRSFSVRGSWSSSWGPKPGESGCKCPQNILDEGKV